MTADLLETIIAGTRRIVEVRESREPLGRLAERAARRAPARGTFKNAISASGRINIIAECKRRSPSRGVLRKEYDAAEIARGYEDAGAAAVSVLTEPTFFDGSLEDLRRVRDSVAIPILRKDFVVSEYQLFEARANGADAVLLIVAALSQPLLGSLGRRAAELGLDTLVEVHNPEELAVAVDAGAEIVGVNNRNLRTLEVDLTASEAVIARIPGGVVAVSESGLKHPEDLIRLTELGFDAFLIGERFMAAADPAVALGLLVKESVGVAISRRGPS